MQNKYVGDIGDLGKFYLLRKIEESGLRLGINWYLRHDETTNKDGQLRSYLFRESPNTKRVKKPFLQEQEKELFDELTKLQANRSVASVASSRIFSKNALYYSETISPGVDRHTWLQSSLHALASADVIFCDPDNGLEVRSCKPDSTRAGKYVNLDELKAYYNAGKTVVFYQHQYRITRNELSLKLREQITSALSIPSDSITVIYYSPSRLFCIIRQPVHEPELSKAVHAVVTGNMQPVIERL